MAVPVRLRSWFYTGFIGAMLTSLLLLIPRVTARAVATGEGALKFHKMVLHLSGYPTSRANHSFWATQDLEVC